MTEACSERTRRMRFRRDPAGSRLPLTPLGVELLKYLWEFGLLDVPQLSRLSGRSKKGVSRSMRPYFDHGAVDVVPVSRWERLGAGDPGGPSMALGFGGSSPNVYVLTPKGRKILEGMGYSEAAGRGPFAARNSPFVAHELEVSEFGVWLAACAREQPGHELLTWKSGAVAEIGLGQSLPPRSVRPDAWFAYGLGERVLVGLVEVDRGTERGSLRWKSKLQSYGTLFASGRLKEAVGYVNARILVLVPDARRREALARLIEKEADKSLASRIWLSDRRVLESPGIGQATWQCPPPGRTSPARQPGAGAGALRPGRRNDMKLSDSSSEYGHFQEARGDSPSHRKESLRVLRLLQGHVGDRDVGEITPDDLQAFIITVRRRHGLKGRKTVSDLTVFAYHRALAAFFNHLCRREAVASNPMRHVPKPKVRQQVIQPFDEAQLRALLAQPDLKTFVGLRDATIMTFLLDAGCRISECLALTFEAVDLEGRTARIAGKGGKDRIVPFGVRTRAWLERYLEKRAQDGGSQLLFVNQFGEKLTRNGMWQRIELYGRKAGLKGVRTSPHTFRHTFAVSWLVGNDDYKGDALSLQTILGHSSPEMTKRYVSFANKDLGKLHDRLSPADRTGFLPRRRTANGSGERHPESEIVGPV